MPMTTMDSDTTMSTNTSFGRPRTVSAAGVIFVVTATGVVLVDVVVVVVLVVVLVVVVVVVVVVVDVVVPRRHLNEPGLLIQR